MRNLIATCQLVVLVVLAISVMHEFRNAEAGRQARLKLLQTISAVESPACEQAPPAQDGTMATLPNDAAVSFTSGVTITTSEWVPGTPGLFRTLPNC